MNGPGDYVVYNERSGLCSVCGTNVWNLRRRRMSGNTVHCWAYQIPQHGTVYSSLMVGGQMTCNGSFHHAFECYDCGTITQLHTMDADGDARCVGCSQLIA